MYSHKQTKSIITKETIKKDLLFRMKSAIPIIIVSCVLCVILLLFGIAMLDDLVYEINNFGWSFSSAEGIIVIAVIILLFPLSQYWAYTNIKVLKEAKRYNFKVVEDRLSRAEEEVIVTSRHSRIEKVFYFYEHGRYVVSVCDGSAFEYSSPEDEFYLIFANDTSSTPLLIYNKKVYEYKQ